MIRARFTGLSDTQIKDLATLAGANRNVFEQKLRGFGIKDEKVMDALESAFYHKTQTSQQTLGKYLTTSQMTELTSAVEGEWAKSQVRFTQLIKQSPNLASVSDATSRKIYNESGWIYSIAEDQTEARGAAVKSDWKKLETALGKLDNTISNAQSEGAIADANKVRKDALQWIAEPLNNAQRNRLFDIAQAVGFAVSVISAVRSYYGFTPQNVATATAAQGGKIIESDIMARLRSVDDLAKQKLEEMKKEDSEGKRLGSEEKRKIASERLREEANRILMEEQEKGKKAETKAPDPVTLEQAQSIRSDMRDEVQAIDKARNSLLRKMPSLDKVFADPKFEQTFEDHRGEEVMALKKYFQTGMVPVKVLDAVANIRPPDVASYGPMSQLAILRAYRKTLQDFDRITPKAM
jgi:hypothetical protein